MTTSSLRSVLAVLGLALIVLALGAAPASPPSVPFLPGVMVKDDHPQGCVDCHINAGEGKDYRLSKGVGALPDHPSITNAFKNALIPDACLLCHKEGSKLGSMTAIIHKVHYEGKANSTFVMVYQGSCLNCHAIDLNTGAMHIKSGPANW
jgi:mono/diheme cytochrome c family protein